ncbi:MAG: ABC transporter ATP-binding protein/permease, partial [Holophagales bacterium]|nr:ABC transporter ATP-binding protein/permease [Holophagales bacterium]
EAVKENLDGIETIQSLNAGDQMVSKTVDRSNELELNELAADRITASLSGLVWLTTGLGVALTWWLGATRVQAGEMTIGSLVVFTGFVTFAYQPFRQFTNIARAYRQGLVSLERIQDLLDRPQKLEERAGADELELTEGKVELRGVRFAYGETTVLDGIDLVIRPRRLTAIVGRSGGGKSSLLRLIARLYDPDQGQVLLDGRDVRGVTLRSLRRQISIVPQRPFLFTGTIRENLTFACPDATLQQVIRACADAGARAFIEELPRGLETRIGNGGIELSGGEMQRLTVARALLSSPRLLLLDEPTAALDREAAAALLETLERISRRVTVVMVGHGLEAMKLADDIVVMDRGRVIASGSEEVLAAHSQTFRNLFGDPVELSA